VFSLLINQETSQKLQWRFISESDNRQAMSHLVRFIAVLGGYLFVIVFFRFI
jgi:hypothetical protein